MARAVSQSDRRVVLLPVVVPAADVIAQKPKAPLRKEERGVSCEFMMGQISAVLSLARTTKLNYREAVKQIETIVQKYERNIE